MLRDLVSLVPGLGVPMKLEKNQAGLLVGPRINPQPCPLKADQVTILQLASVGLSNSDIAKRTNTTPDAVKSRWVPIFKVTNIHDRAGSVVYALRRGWI